MMYRANFGDGTYTKGYSDIRDVKLVIMGQAAIVQYRSFIEECTNGRWIVAIPSKAQRNGPAIVERDIMTRQQTADTWREIESAVHAAGWLLQHADCNGPLADRPTADPGVQAILSARRYLLKRANRLRQELSS